MVNKRVRFSSMPPQQKTFEEESSTETVYRNPVWDTSAHLSGVTAAPYFDELMVVTKRRPQTTKIHSYDDMLNNRAASARKRLDSYRSKIQVEPTFYVPPLWPTIRRHVYAPSISKKFEVLGVEGGFHSAARFNSSMPNRSRAASVDRYSLHHDDDFGYEPSRKPAAWYGTPNEHALYGPYGRRHERGYYNDYAFDHYLPPRPHSLANLPGKYIHPQSFTNRYRRGTSITPSTTSWLDGPASSLTYSMSRYRPLATYTPSINSRSSRYAEYESTLPSYPTDFKALRSRLTDVSSSAASHRSMIDRYLQSDVRSIPEDVDSAVVRKYNEEYGSNKSSVTIHTLKDDVPTRATYPKPSELRLRIRDVLDRSRHTGRSSASVPRF